MVIIHLLAAAYANSSYCFYVCVFLPSMTVPSYLHRFVVVALIPFIELSGFTCAMLGAYLTVYIASEASQYILCVSSSARVHPLSKMDREG